MKPLPVPIRSARKAKTPPAPRKPRQGTASVAAIGTADTYAPSGTAAESTAPRGAVDPLDLAPVVGDNLHRMRVKRGLSLERLAQASGVSRAMLGQIELRQSTPTINVLWKIARALNVPFSALITHQAAHRTKVLAAGQAKVLTSNDGTFSSRALFPFGEARNVEFYELRLAPRATEKADAHPPGTVENLVVTSGSLEMQVGEERYSVSTGDAIQFDADVPHTYRNTTNSEVTMYLVMTYAEKLG